MTEDKFQLPTTTSVPAADVTFFTDSNDPIVSTRSYPVKQPNEDANDFVVEIRASVLKRLREELTGIQESAFPWHEFSLGLSTTFLGTAIGALTSGQPLTKADSITLSGAFSYLVCPVLFVLFGTISFFKRREEGVSISKFAKTILKDLPDPKETTDGKRS